MDQRRIFAFMLMMLAALMLSQTLFPVPEPPKVAVEDGQAELADEAPMPPAVAEDFDVVQPPDAPARPEAAPDTKVPLERVTIGSVDPSGPFPMLVSFVNRGAAIERVELASPRFRDQHDLSGYLGHVVHAHDPFGAEVERPVEQQGDGASAGALVTVVGDGTPAQQAGLQVGDRIVGFRGAEDVEITSAESFQEALAETSPGQKITLQVARGDDPPRALEVTLRRRPLEVIRPEVENVRMRDGEMPPDFVPPPSYLMSLHSVDGVRFEGAHREQIDGQLHNENWEIIDRSDQSVTFRQALPALELEFLKRFTIKPVPPEQQVNPAFPGYDLDLEIEIRNTGGGDRSVSYVISGPNGLPIEGWWFAHRVSRSWSASGLRDVVVRFLNKRAEQVRCTTISDGKADPMGQGSPMAFVAVDAQYFASALIPQKKSADEVWFDNTIAVRVGPEPSRNTPKTLANVSFEVQRSSQRLTAGSVLTDSYTIFAGPKRPELLEQYYVSDAKDYNLSDLVYYGWFGTISKFLLNVLHFFHSWVGNYGIAIIMLTIAVRSLMFPLSLKQTKSMARMQALKPELDRINEKYKNDVQKKQQAMQELYAKHQINPLSGCLPMFIQLPIFMGLYRGLMIDIELRQSPLFSDAIRWCSNLAAPDMFYNWSWLMPHWVNSGIGLFALGPYLNLLPLVAVALFLISQQMFMPEPTNDQARMQQKMMKYMTVFMGLLFYKVASGLCLYFIVSSLWGILERKLLPKTAGVGEGASPQAPPAAGGSGPRPPRRDGGTPPRGDGTPRNGVAKDKKRQKARQKARRNK